ncbi:hypothetical protein LTR50_002612 [Elasticomyces elasticus]|nr:hypothetical protein LTR50_002612 [Elasticomyces elasticus]
MTGMFLATSAPATDQPLRTPALASRSTALPDKIRGVNIGGWLVLESWMNPDVFDGTGAIDQWTLDSTPGAEAKLQAHWGSYFTEDDVAQIASWGINALRIPIGYWAYNNTGTPYISGADAYLEKAISWSRNHGLKVLIDCHGSPGSQNGFDNSGKSGNVAWQSGDNLGASITVLETIATKYGSTAYADVVFAIELVNEPISWAQNNFDLTKQWAQDAYNAVRSAAANKDLMIVMHDGFMGPNNWEDVGAKVNGGSTPMGDARFAVDVHLYQNMMPDDNKLTQAEHITKACKWTSTSLLPPSSNLPVLIGEFSAVTNICARPDGSTVPGVTCDTDGCQCASNVPTEQWNPPLVAATRRFFEAQMDAFEHSSRGWFMWSYHGYGAWGLATAVKYGLIGKTVTERMYPGQCDGVW